METFVLALVALLCAGAALVWARSARYRQRFLRRLEDRAAEATKLDDESRAALQVARSSVRKDVHTAAVYGLLAIALAVIGFAADYQATIVLAIVAVPALVAIAWANTLVRDARAAHARYEIERRAEEALAQEQLAPKAWAGRLAPEELPDLTGFEVGRIYQAGSGLMAGDFFDVYRVSPTRVAAVIGDVAGHGIESSITAFQAKYLLRVFLRQFRDPAQALEELNNQMSNVERGEEFISLVVIVFDTEAGTLRFASAGHPAAWLWHQREVQPLRATGPLLMLDASSGYYSREIPLDSGDMALLYTDGLAEARNGNGDLFGEDRIAQQIKRDPGVAPDVLCKTLLEAAQDFSEGPIDDDVALLAIRRN